METWHLTPDAPRRPRRARPMQPVELVIGTWPIAAGQSVCDLATHPRRRDA